MYDIVIIGAGPAGLTAAIYGIRAGLSVVVLESMMYGGQIAGTPEVENYPSIQKISGWQLAQNIYDQAVAQGVEVKFEAVEKIELGEGNCGGIKTVVTPFNRYECKTVIIANGAKRRLLGCPGEEEFKGMGVSYCATCDGAFFRGKTTAVVGGGNTALEDSLFLSNLCEKVYLIVRKDKFRGEKRLAEAVLARENIEILYSHVVDRIEGDGLVSAVIVKDSGGETKKLDVSAVFVAIGMVPDNGAFADVVELDDAGYIVADETCKTSCAGIFAAGDSRTKEVRQIITAASDGAVAAVAAANLVNAEG
ncbi:MAG: FAD-dependent oxidoreductase [Firmicutes bacterium]|nr:FAD-dependent oxidoreductase [Bacillota bacterium]